MKLIKYLTESDRYKNWESTPEDLITLLKKECSKYLNESKGNWFTRSVEIKITKNIPYNIFNVIYREIRKDRKPLGMNPDVFSKFNEWLRKNGHADRSKSISCANESGLEFGEKYIIFIKGNYKYTWIKANDVNVNDVKTGWANIYPDIYLGNNTLFGSILPRYINNYGLEMRSAGNDRIAKENVFNKYKTMSREWLDKNFNNFFTTNKNMKEAWNKHYEIWFEGEGYYLIDYKDKGKLDEIKNKLI